jgi:branched-subunit amino acid transport protein
VLVVAIAQFSLVLTGLLFPHGRMTTRWHWLALVVAVVTLVDAVAEAWDIRRIIAGTS